MDEMYKYYCGNDVYVYINGIYIYYFRIRESKKIEKI